MFPQHLASLPIRPSHSHRPYQVTSGAYRLKNFRPKAITFDLVRNRDYYQAQKGLELIGLPLNASSTLRMQSKPSLIKD